MLGETKRNIFAEPHVALALGIGDEVNLMHVHKKALPSSGKG
jgi:hypothetical protein